jgi:hypothetical protein
MLHGALLGWMTVAKQLSHPDPSQLALPRKGIVPKLYAVINPEDDPKLLFTLTEGAALAQFFPQSQRTIDTGSKSLYARIQRAGGAAGADQ